MKQFKNFFRLRDQQWSDDGPLIKKKILNIFGNALKAVPVTFRDFGQKQKNKFRVSKDFW